MSQGVFDHSQHKLAVEGLAAALDVLSFEGREQLSEPFLYRVEFTSAEQDIAVELMLGKRATFSLHPPPSKLPLLGLPAPQIKPLRTVHGVVTGFERLSSSRDEARYQLTLQPRLALLGRGQQYRIYQQQSVPQIVEHILRSRHEFEGQHFHFDLVREYPRREQVMQYGESDLAFITRLLADVGIWYRFTSDDRLRLDVVEFHDDQRRYQFGLALPCRPPSGLSSTGEDAVWALQACHQVVEQRINMRSYQHLKARAFLDGEVDQSRGATTTYGESYRYAEPYAELGDALDQHEDLLSESGFFYARLRHELYLNDQTRLSGVSSSAALAPGQVLKISGGAPQAFAPGAVITRLVIEAARDRSLTARFEAIPYSHSVCFRPPLAPKPQIAGTVPARVTSSLQHDRYGHIDLHGRYRVNFLFDRDTWKTGEESAWLRLARPYAGDTHGLHLPLIQGTEVAVAFEQGDPDRPYIAHALHDSQHPDHVTLRNYQRNVLRTPANNKLRMDDTRGQEHVKLSSEHGGKSQLNLGHVVDGQKQKRGEGFELRSDAWGAIRGGKGLFISADEQTKAQGEQLDMAAAINQLEGALSLARSLANAARIAESTPSDTDSQARLGQALKGLAQPGVVLHAPAGIGLLSPASICVSSGSESVGVMAAHNTDISAGLDITASAEERVSVLANKGPLQLKAGNGPVQLHALGSHLHALAKTDIKIESVEGRVEISAPQELVLSCGGAYIRLRGGEIELGAPGNIYLKSAHVQKLAGASLDTPPTALPSGYAGRYILNDEAQAPLPFTRYRITTAEGEVFEGQTDKDGRTMAVNTQLPEGLTIELPEAILGYDVQLRLRGEDGKLASNLKYSIALADGRAFSGTTDAQGQTQRIATHKPTPVTALTLFPPQSVEGFCCAAQNIEVPMVVDLADNGIATNDLELGNATQEIALPKGKRRPLTPGEMAMARALFKDAVDYTKVWVYHAGWWVFAGQQSTAVTPNGKMYFPESTALYRDDFSSTSDHRDKALFIHEMTHVWQYQLGYAVKRHGLTVSSQGAKAYRYVLSESGTLSDYNMEQQGEILSDYYMICVLGQPHGVWDPANANKPPALLATTVADFLRNPADKSHLPG